MILTQGLYLKLDLADIGDSRVKAVFFFNITSNWKNLIQNSEKNDSNFLQLVGFLTK